MPNAFPSKPGRTPSRIAAMLAAVLLATSGQAHAAYIGISQNQTITSIYGGDFEFGFSSNGHNTNLGRGGAALTVPNGTTLSFTGQLIDRGGTVASRRQIFVLPYAGANYAIADVSLSNTASSSVNPYSSNYTLSGIFRTDENLPLPANAETIVAGQSVDFNSPFASNTLFTTPVPEPASMLLLGTGAAAVLAVRRRVRRAAQSAPHG